VGGDGGVSPAILTSAVGFRREERDVLGWKRIRDKLQEALSGETDEKALAAGFAVGVFFSFTPLISLHTVLALLVAFVFRLSKVAAAAGVWVNNPYTMPIVFYGCFRLGEWLLGIRVPPPAFERWTLETVLKAAVPYAAPLFLGTTIVGLLAAAAAYMVVYRVAVKVKSARRKAHDPRAPGGTPSEKEGRP
jgi:hypothetical protein